jgi:quercetin dioxygenase-like cupin family protein
MLPMAGATTRAPMADDITVIRLADIAPETLGAHPIIEGETTIQRLIDKHTDGNPEQLNVAMVNFEPGSQNVSHAHSSAQLLFVTAGEGFVATAERRFMLTPGAVVFIPAGVAHSHGAGQGAAFSHLTITLNGAQTKVA